MSSGPILRAALSAWRDAAWREGYEATRQFGELEGEMKRQLCARRDGTGGGTDGRREGRRRRSDEDRVGRRKHGAHAGPLARTVAASAAIAHGKGRQSGSRSEIPSTRDRGERAGSIARALESCATEYPP